MRALALVIVFVSTVSGAADWFPLSPANQSTDDDLVMASGAPMQQWFIDLEPQISEWAKCDYAFLGSGYPDGSSEVSATLRARVLRLLPSVRSGASAYQLNIEYTKAFYSWRGFQSGLSQAGSMTAQAISKAWAQDCLKKYRD